MKISSRVIGTLSHSSGFKVSSFCCTSPALPRATISATLPLAL